MSGLVYSEIVGFAGNLTTSDFWAIPLFSNKTEGVVMTEFPLQTFDQIAGGLADVAATADQILAAHRDDRLGQPGAERQVPFGTELFTELDQSKVALGETACVAALGTQVDDSSTWPEDGNPPFTDPTAHQRDAAVLF
jgi:hypothetical protein